MIQTEDEVRTKFLAELKALLTKWNAELSAKDHWNGYAECGEDVRMTVDIPGIYAESEVLRPYVEIDLGSYQCPLS